LLELDDEINDFGESGRERIESCRERSEVHIFFEIFLNEFTFLFDLWSKFLDVFSDISESVEGMYFVIDFVS
jgi:hypothetical protein